MEATGINWKQIYHWVNVIVIPLWAISAVMSSFEEAAQVFSIAGSIWIVISGLINQRVRDFVLKFLAKFFGSIGLGTVIVSCLFAGFALIAILILFVLLSSFIAIAGLLVLAIYLFATSAQALVLKIY